MDSYVRVVQCAQCGQHYDCACRIDYEDSKGNHLCSWVCWEDWQNPDLYNVCVLPEGR